MANLKAAGIVISICLYGGSLFAQQDDAHRAYEEAVGIKKVEQRIAALEAFLVQQPPSELQKKALGQLLADYLVVRSLDLQEKTAKRLLAIDEKNLRALALLVYACHSGDRDFFTAGQFAEFKKNCRSYAERGLQVLRTDSLEDRMPPQEAVRLEVVFRKYLGLDASISGDRETAEHYLQDAVRLDPSDFGVVYPLSANYLKDPKTNCETTLWYVARAGILAPTSTYRKQLQEWGKREYVEKVGSAEGWSKLLDTAARNTEKPTNLKIACKPPN